MRSGLILFFVGCSLLSVNAQLSRDYRSEAVALKKVLMQNHFQPKPVNDEFAGNVFHVFLETLDPDKIYFTETDLAPLQKYRTQIDDELSGTGWNFLDAFKPVLKNALTRGQTLVEQTSQVALNESSKEIFIYDTLLWPAGETELKSKWKQWFAYETLDRMTNLQRNENETSSAFFRRAESEARKKVRAIELRSIRRVLEHPSGFDSYIASLYFQSIASVFDPHTAYLSATDMENLLSSLSTEGYYFGVSLDENDHGDITIASLTPGSPAWRSGELHQSDVLVSLKWEGQHPIEMDGLSLEEADQILADANHMAIEFTVRKMSGLLKSVKLKKEKISMEENFVHSYILKGNHRIGYISLPDFYTQWGDESEGSRCANDVAREIIKLKKENVEGVILDIRYNSGGSLQEALAMAGIFIDEGSLGLTKDQQQNVVSMKDMNRGTVYDGPLLVMVNGQSASASELLAGVLQDYNRAIITGSRTYGKSTMQNFFPIQGTMEELSLETLKNGKGIAKITTDKFYRVTGKSVQGKGIIPDVMLPDVFDAIEFHESAIPFALPADSVSKRTYYRSLPSLPVGVLRKQSEARLASDKSFAEIRHCSDWLSQELHKKYEGVSLSWADVEREANQQKARYKSLEESLNQVQVSYEVLNTEMDQQRFTADEYGALFNKTRITSLSKDLYIEESFRILADLIDYSKN